MIIKYATGGQRDIDQDIDLVTTKLSEEFGPDFIHCNGLIWEADDHWENDDGANAVAVLLDNDGNRLTNFLPGEFAERR